MSVRALRTIRGKRSALVSTLLTVALVPTVLIAAQAPAATPCGSPPATFPTSQMSAGMTGIGYTVLQGQTLVPFDVEILGVMPNAIFLGVDVVVAKITGPAGFLATTGGAIGGMSGSPVYIDGRLAGAVAWVIAEDRHIFGMTAAEDMVGMFDLPGAGEPGSMPDAVELTPEVRAAARSAGSPVAVGASLEALPVPLGVSGLSGMPLSEIETQFADQGVAVRAFRAGSVAAPAIGSVDPSHFRPGDGLGVALSYGDVSSYGFGTTTAVCGDVVIGFGHPMFYGIGRVSLGMAEVNVIAIDNGTFFGTKIGILGDAHGVLTQDRFAGVAGVFGGLPTIVPITSVMSSPDTGLSRQGETDVAWDDDYFVANTAFSHVYSNVTNVAQEDAPGTLALGWTISGTREDGSPFTVTNRLIGFSDYSASSEAYDLANVISTISTNGFEDVQITGVGLTGRVTEANLTSRIAGIRVSSPLQPTLRPRSVVRAKPGDVVRIEVTLDPIDGPDIVATMSVRVPRSARGTEPVTLSGGKARLDFCGVGGAVPPIDLGVGNCRPRSFDDLLAALNGGGHADELIVTAFGQALTKIQDVIVHGRGGFAIQVVR
jgi:hypothetical protein